MEIIESQVFESSITLENNETNCLFDNAIDQKLNQKPINVEKKVHEFYFIKYWPHEDQTLKSRIQEAEKLYKRINVEAWALAGTFDERLLGQSNAYTELRHLHSRNRHTAYGLEWTLNKLDQLQEALDSLSKTVYQRRGMKSCSSGELVNSVRMLHGTKNLATEKKLLKEIDKSQLKEADASFSPVLMCSFLYEWLSREKQWQKNKEDRNKQILNTIQRLEETGQKAIENAAMRGIIWNTLGTRKAIQAQIRLMSKISEELRKEHLEINSKIKYLEKELEIIQRDVNNFRKEFDNVKKRREQMNRHILTLQRQQDEEIGRYCRYASVLSNARELASKKNVKSLQELSLREVDTFISRRNRSKAFRYNYERSILQSLESRQLSRDGRLINRNEESLLF